MTNYTVEILNENTVVELRKIAKGLEIKLSTNGKKLVKAELIEAIMNKQPKAQTEAKEVVEIIEKWNNPTFISDDGDSTVVNVFEGIPAQKFINQVKLLVSHVKEYWIVFDDAKVYANKQINLHKKNKMLVKLWDNALKVLSLLEATKRSRNGGVGLV